MCDPLFVARENEALAEENIQLRAQLDTAQGELRETRQIVEAFRRFIPDTPHGLDAA
jgi:hypothetical protein